MTPTDTRRIKKIYIDPPYEKGAIMRNPYIPQNSLWRHAWNRRSVELIIAAAALAILCLIFWLAFRPMPDAFEGQRYVPDVAPISISVTVGEQAVELGEIVVRWRAGVLEQRVDGRWVAVEKVP